MELYATKEGPKMAEIGPETDTFMKTAVWKFRKGLSRDDCVSIEPLMTPGMYLRAQRIEVPINPPEEPAAAPADREQNVIRDIGESVDSKGIFNSLFLPGPHGATAVPYSEVQGVKHDVRESNTVKQEASVTAPTKTVMTVVVAKNDNSLSFLKVASSCARSSLLIFPCVRTPRGVFEIRANLPPQQVYKQLLSNPWVCRVSF